MSLDCGPDFGDFDGRIWMNAAAQGPLPKPAVSAAQCALADKVSPRRIDPALFLSAAEGLRSSLAAFLGAIADDVFLGNSVTHGLSIVANGLEWKAGDEVLVIAGDYPACVYPWLPLRRQGVVVKVIRPASRFPVVDDVRAHLGRRTRVLCASWVDSLTGYAIDADAFGEICRANDTLLVLDVAQAAGARVIDVGQSPADVISGCGYKFLCGPYGTGFGWISSAMHDRLVIDPCYWYAMASDEQEPPETGARYSFRTDLDFAPRSDLPQSARFDVFNTPNFMTFIPWRASVDYISGLGMKAVAEHDMGLVRALLAGIPKDKFVVNSPEDDMHLSTLVNISHREPGRTTEAAEAISASGIDVTYRFGNIRLSPHVYNSLDDTAQLIAVLEEF